VQHLHGAVAEEQLGVVAGEVEAGGMVAAGLDAKRVGDADVAAAPGAVVTSSQPTSACCRSWYFRAAKRRDHQQHGHYSSSKC